MTAALLDGLDAVAVRPPADEVPRWPGPVPRGAGPTYRSVADATDPAPGRRLTWPWSVTHTAGPGSAPVAAGCASISCGSARSGAAQPLGNVKWLRRYRCPARRVSCRQPGLSTPTAGRRRRPWATGTLSGADRAHPRMGFPARSTKPLTRVPGRLTRGRVEQDVTSVVEPTLDAQLARRAAQHRYLAGGYLHLHAGQRMRTDRLRLKPGTELKPQRPGRGTTPRALGLLDRGHTGQGRPIWRRSATPFRSYPPVLSCCTPARHTTLAKRARVPMAGWSSIVSRRSAAFHGHLQ